MQIEHKTGETTVKDKDGNETKQTYELDMHLTRKKEAPSHNQQQLGAKRVSR